MMDSVKEKRIFRMGRLFQISYDVCGEDNYARTYEYSGGMFAASIINTCYSCHWKSPPKDRRRFLWKGGVSTKILQQGGVGWGNALTFQKVDSTTMKSDSTNERIGDNEPEDAIWTGQYVLLDVLM